MVHKTEWCPQHGYPLPCAKCGLSELTEHERSVQQGRQEVVDWIKQQELTEPNEDSTTKFYPFYTFFKKDLDDKCVKDWGIR